MTIIGAKFRPFIDIESLLPWRSALLTQEEVDRRVALSFRTYNDKMKYGFDASGFDFHLHERLMKDCADIIISRFNLDKNDLMLAK